MATVRPEPAARKRFLAECRIQRRSTSDVKEEDHKVWIFQFSDPLEKREYYETFATGGLALNG